MLIWQLTYIVKNIGIVFWSPQFTLSFLFVNLRHLAVWFHVQFT